MMHAYQIRDGYNPNHEIFDIFCEISKVSRLVKNIEYHHEEYNIL